MCVVSLKITQKKLDTCNSRSESWELPTSSRVSNENGIKAIQDCELLPHVGEKQKPSNVDPCPFY